MLRQPRPCFDFNIVEAKGYSNERRVDVIARARAPLERFERAAGSLRGVRRDDRDGRC